MSRIKCIFFEASTKVKRYFRRYQDGDCLGKGEYHNAEIFYDEIEVPVPIDGFENDPRMISGLPHKNLKAQYPQKCDHCDFIFTDGSTFQKNPLRQYFCEATGEYFELNKIPVGGMYFAPWLDCWTTPQLAHVLIVRTPGGSWAVDSQASNCTKPKSNGEKGRLQSDHHCWIIEGDIPPNITVSKNGNTCGAGAGSIQCGKYHGFLRNGYLEEC